MMIDMHRAKQDVKPINFLISCKQLQKLLPDAISKVRERPSTSIYIDDFTGTVKDPKSKIKIQHPTKTKTQQLPVAALSTIYYLVVSSHSIATLS